MEVYFDESDEPLFEVDIFADSDRETESEPDNTMTEVEAYNMPDAEPETDQHIETIRTKTCNIHFLCLAKICAGFTELKQ